MADKQKQVSEQCRAVSHLATALAQIHSDYAKMLADGKPNDGFVEQVGKRTAALMETLGEILNGMDAADETDDWMIPIFREAQRLWPASRGKDN